MSTHCARCPKFGLPLVLMLMAGATVVRAAPTITEGERTTAPAWDYAFVSAQTTGAGLITTLDTLTAKVIDAMQKGQLHATGGFVLTFHDAPADLTKPYTLDVGVPVKHGDAAPAGMQVVAVPPVDCWSVKMTGKLADLGQAYVKLDAGLAELDREPSGIKRQVFSAFQGPVSEKSVYELRAELKPVIAAVSPSHPAPPTEPQASSPKTTPPPPPDQKPPTPPETPKTPAAPKQSTLSLAGAQMHPKLASLFDKRADLLDLLDAFALSSTPSRNLPGSNRD